MIDDINNNNHWFHDKADLTVNSEDELRNTVKLREVVEIRGHHGSRLTETPRKVTPWLYDEEQIMPVSSRKRPPESRPSKGTNHARVT